MSEQKTWHLTEDYERIVSSSEANAFDLESSVSDRFALVDYLNDLEDDHGTVAARDIAEAFLAGSNAVASFSFSSLAGPLVIQRAINAEIDRDALKAQLIDAETELEQTLIHRNECLAEVRTLQDEVNRLRAYRTGRYASVGFGGSFEVEPLGLSIHDTDFCNRDGYGHFGKMVAAFADGDLGKAFLDAYNERDALKSQAEALAAALLRYGDHDGGCPSIAPVPSEKRLEFPDDDAWMGYLDGLVNGCTCGYDAALRAWDEAQP